MSKKRSKIKDTLLKGAALIAAAKMFGGKEMMPGRDSEVGAIAAQKNKLRIPDAIKKRGAGMDGAFLPKMPKGKTKIPESEFFGIDPFGPGMGAKKGKMIKAAGGALVGRGQGKVMRVKNTKII
jgi:hypothetical protein